VKLPDPLARQGGKLAPDSYFGMEL